MEELLKELKGLSTALAEKDEAHRAEVKKYGEATAETKAAIDAISERLSDVETQITRPAGDGGERRGDITDAERKAADGFTRLAERKVTPEQVREHDAAFFNMLRRGEGKAGLAADERKALVEDATGEIIVPFDLEAGVLRVLPQLNVMRDLCLIRPTIRNRVSLRALTEVSVGWGKLETGGTLTESTQVPSQQYVYVEDMYGLTKLGEDEVMDTDVALTEIVANSFGIAAANAEEHVIVNGLGHASEQPEGILVHSGAGPDGTSLVAVSATTVANDIGWEDLIDLEYALKPQYAARASYVVNRSTAKRMRLFKDANDRPLWQEPLSAGEPATFNGKPVHQSVEMPALPTSTATNVNVALFGDYKAGYVIVERLGLTLKVLGELYAESGMIGYRVHRRVGGNVLRGEAIAKLQLSHA